MLERSLISDLLKWRQKSLRKPILLDGARQTGKTFLLKEMFSKTGNFRQLHYLDFERDPSLENLFHDGLGPESVIDNIGLRFGQSVEPEKDLIIFDEIGSCNAALQSLKYFAEELPRGFVIATGSNINLLQSFPVGKVEMMSLFPLTFEEFLNASVPDLVVKAYKENLGSNEAHRQLWSTLLEYFYAGGMPDAVNNWIAPNLPLVERVQNVKAVHQTLLDSYVRDFGKYSGPIHALHIESVFTNIPRQLGKNIDGSVKRFRFREPIEAKRRYAELKGPIDWLNKSKLISKNYPITHEPAPPLNVHIRENVFKLFLFDVGLLGFMAGMSYQDQKDQTTSYKGFVAENFVQNELIAQGLDHTYSWEENQAQIEFVIRTSEGEIVPVEVKSGTRTQAKSLASYINRYEPNIAIKLIGARGGKHGNLQTLPLYYASTIPEMPR